METTDLNVKVDAALKRDVEQCLADLGLDLSTAIGIYFKQILIHRGIPFWISACPNQETLDAIAEGERIADDPSVPGYQDMPSLIKALNS